MRHFYQTFLSIRHLPVPTIAAINGHAVGAGACITLACDIRLMSLDAKFGLNFVKLGLTPGMGGSHTLSLLTNPQVAARIILTGDLVSATEAKELGMVLETYEDPEKLMRGALDLARRIAANSPVAVRAATRTLRLRIDDGLERALWREADTQGLAYAGADMKEGLDAIKNKRTPLFKDFPGN
jgi:enoyl-CoA hydratase/carnithine racemase